MSPENKKRSAECAVTDGVDFEETELTLGLPGESRGVKLGSKRGFLETIELNLGSSDGNCGLNPGSSGGNCDDKDCDNRRSENDASSAAEPPAKSQVVGWPPVRAFRKNAMKKCKYVKVAVDGAPYLRKADLEMYNTYQQLLRALEDMFSCFKICTCALFKSYILGNYLNERKRMDPANGMEYVPTYEDKDGDWMLVGDVPWKMFVESCKRLRLMKSSDAIGLARRTSPKCTR